jgi:transaldolase
VQAANQLEALKVMSKVVADTGELQLIERYRPIDATTNPTLIYKAVQNPDYEHFLQHAIDQEGRNASVSAIADCLAVAIGSQILQIVPGRVSTEVDARLSYDTVATVDKALHLIDLYSKAGYDPSRIYIKIASTWEGIRACERLQKQGIDCNMTLLFSFAQAAACADAGAALISPFVGRILDWYKKNKGRDYTADEDPGVLSVKRIYSYYKQYGYRTTVMAASFRTVDEVRALAGCDAITISPAILQQLETSTEDLPYQLWFNMGGCIDPLIDLGSNARNVFEQVHYGDAMAVEKLREGVDGFTGDIVKLEAMLTEKLGK